MIIENTPSNLSNTEKVESESLKLFKNTKGYNWEIKLFSLPNSNDSVMRDKQLIDRMVDFDNEMKKKFGSELNLKGFDLD